jgi:hypothetical protein
MKRRLLMFGLAVAACAGCTTTLSAKIEVATTPPPVAAAPLVAVPAAAPTLPTSIEAYADAFVAAWHVGDTTTLDRLGTPDAVTKAHAHDDVAPQTWTRSGCDGTAGSSFCTYGDPANDQLIVQVGNEAASLGQDHAVTDVRFSAGLPPGL